MKTLILSGMLSVIALAGCSSTSSNASSSTDQASNNIASSKDDGMVCKMERKVGSNMMRRVCYTAEEREMMEEAARESWTRMQRGTETSGSGL